MTEHYFHFSANWPGGRNSVGTIHSGQLETKVSIATGMGGPGVGTNPDEMLLGAAATCYLMTLAAMLEHAHLPVLSLTLESDITVVVDRGAYRCTRIVHRPGVTLAAHATAAQMARLASLVNLAEQHCMVSNALRGNVDISVAAQIEQLP
ncbi:MAG: SACOL1771 family peroxiredoxin [Rhodanobacteraceae bacterium]|nr:MAG: SACOL1771 family peroxiredoxin [Rhodanobacteraceae bacterium]